MTRFSRTLIPEVQSTPWYRAGGEIIVEWDESDTDNVGISGGGGGHIPTIVMSNSLRPSPLRDSSSRDTAGILRSIEDVYGLAHLAAARDAANGTIDALLGRPPGPGPYVGVSVATDGPRAPTSTSRALTAS